MSPTLDLLYGSRRMPVELPERTRIIEGPEPLEPIDDVAGAVRTALADPYRSAPIAKLVGPKAKVTIAFDDCAAPVPAMAEPDFRAVAIPILLEELSGAGVDWHDIKLICANALHRKWSRNELATILGPTLPLALGPQRLYCHDACDPGSLAYLGETARGFEVEVNRAVVESDLMIYVNVTPTPMNGGWKSVAVGLSTFRSIRHHHRPFPLARGHSVMDPHRSAFHKLIWELGGVIQSKLDERGRHILSLECGITSHLPPRVSGVFCGRMPDVHDLTLEQVNRQLVADAGSPADCAIYGLPNQDPYSKLSRINPILVTNLGLAYTFGMYQGEPLVREGGILVLVNPFEEEIDPINHAPYVEFYDRLLDISTDPFELWDYFVEDFAERPEYVHRYRHAFSFHGAHPFFMWNSLAFPRRHLSAIFVAGAKDDRVVRRLGFEPFPTVAQALREVEERLGESCSIAVPRMPPVFIPRVGSHGET